MNSNYFHVVMRGRRRRLYIHRIQDDESEWIEGDVNVSNTTCDHFHHIFTREKKMIQDEVLNHIPRLVTDD